MTRLILSIFCLIAPVSCWSETLSGRIVGVTDGDTVTLLTESNAQVKVRLAVIDAPEKTQAFGAASKKSLSDLCFNKQAAVVVQGKDRYGRTIGYLSCDGINAAEEQLMNGMAWVYRKYNHDPDMIAMEDEAKANSTGLWSDRSPIPPWEYRRGVNKKSGSEAASEKNGAGFSCAGKTKCGQMVSCDEAMFYLHTCGVTRLDRDHDGTPCESICR